MPGDPAAPVLGGTQLCGEPGVKGNPLSVSAGSANFLLSQQRLHMILQTPSRTDLQSALAIARKGNLQFHFSGTLCNTFNLSPNNLFLQGGGVWGQHREVCLESGLVRVERKKKVLSLFCLVELHVCKYPTTFRQTCLVLTLYLTLFTDSSLTGWCGRDRTVFFCGGQGSPLEDLPLEFALLQAHWFSGFFKIVAFLIHKYYCPLVHSSLPEQMNSFANDLFASMQQEDLL